MASIKYKTSEGYTSIPMNIIGSRIYLEDYDDGEVIPELVDDNAKLGFGYYTCTTAGATAAKEVTANGFVLKPNCSLAVLFTNAFVAADTTLNINSTGAKLIKYYGNNIPNYVVKANTILTLVYDGTNYNVVNVEQKPKDDDLWVDLGLPSGLKWAKKNIDVTQTNGFAASEFQYECSFFSWGNKDGHNPISSSAFDYDWGNDNEGPYASTMGSKLTGNIPLSQDSARIPLGAPWRMPTEEEFVELINNCDFIDASGDVIDSSVTDKRTTVNDIVGLYLQSKNNGNRIFFPCSGYGFDSSWLSRGLWGVYWSSSLATTVYARSLFFSSGNVDMHNNSSRFDGIAVRAVQ